MTRTGQIRLFICMLLLLVKSVGGFTQTAKLFIDVADQGDEVLAYISIQTDEPIVSAQFSIVWDSTQLAFAEVNSDNPIWNNTPASLTYNTIDAASGIITVAWTAVDLINGVFFENQDTVFVMRFNRLIASEISIAISDEPVPIEVGSLSGAQLKVEAKNGLTNGALIKGVLFVTEPNACSYDSTQTTMGQWQVAAVSESGKIHRTVTDDAGVYYFVLPAGTYTLETVFPNRSWTQCQNIQIINQDSSNQNIDIGIVPTRSCSDLEVGISGFHIEPCTINKYALTYRNWGTQPAEDAYVILTLDSLLNIMGSSHDFTMIDNQTVRFDIGSIGVNESGRIDINISVDCTLPEGKTICVKAEVFPNNQCDESNEMWSGASLDVQGECVEDSVVFIIRNIGDADMITPRQFIITEDIVSFLKDNVQLKAMESEKVALVATGKTYRLEIEQVPFHPGNSIPRAHVEGCGEEPFSYGIVNQFENNDRDPHISESCLTIRAAYLPAELTAMPEGVTEEKYIESTSEIEYSIGFQNSGETTIEDIEVIDTLSEFLDINTVRLTGSSHLLKMSFLSDRVVKFSFPSIDLAPHSVSPENSRGYVTFKVEQLPDNPAGTIITNRALLRFNRVGFTLTDQIFHTVSDNFFQTLSYEPFDQPAFKVLAYPNPFADQMRIVVEAPKDDSYTITLYNQLGQMILKDEFMDEYILTNEDWSEGIYYARIVNSYDQIVTGKFYIRN